jgi:predicted Rdx family selenoprotein
VIEGALGVPSTLIPGRNGIFEVRYNGRVVAKKDIETGFPTEDQIVEALRPLLSR